MTHSEEKSNEKRGKLRVPLASGDLVLFSRNCTSMDPFSMVICLGAKTTGMSPYDHVGMVVEDPNHPEGELLLLEANAKGITMYPLSTRLQRSKAQQIAVRKLVHSFGPEFKTQLYTLAKQYMSKGYNHDMLQMSSATIMSYYYAFLNDFYTQQIQSIHYLIDEYELIQQMLLAKHHLPPTKHHLYLPLDRYLHSLLTSTSSALPINLLFQSLCIRRSQLYHKIQQAQQAIQTTTMPVGKEANSVLLEAKAESYFCSQLVAEIYQHFHILHPAQLHSEGKDTYHYLPADFSSSTWKKGLFTFRALSSDTKDLSCKLPSAIADTKQSALLESVEEKTGLLEGGKSGKLVTFSPDFTVHPKACQLVRDEAKNEVCLEIPLSFLPTHGSAAHHPEKDHNTALKHTAKLQSHSMKFPMHLNDVIPPAVLANMLSLAKEHNLQLQFSGKLRVLHQTRPAVVGMIDADFLQQQTCTGCTIVQYIEDVMQLYGAEHICLQAYSTHASVTLSPNHHPHANTTAKNKPATGAMKQQESSTYADIKAIATSKTMCNKDQKFDIMLIEELFHQAWLGFFEQAASLTEMTFLQRDVNTVKTEDISNTMDTLLHRFYHAKQNLAAQMFSHEEQPVVLQQNVLAFREMLTLLGPAVVDIFLQHRSKHGDVEQWKKRFVQTKEHQLEEDSAVNEDNALFYTLKHIFYFGMLFELMIQRQANQCDVTEELALFHYLLKHYVLAELEGIKVSNVAVVEEQRRRQALVENVMSQVEARFSQVPAGTKQKKGGDEENAVAMAMMLVAIPTSLGACWTAMKKNTAGNKSRPEKEATTSYTATASCRPFHEAGRGFVTAPVLVKQVNSMRPTTAAVQRLLKLIR